MKVAIIGAGVAGMACTYELERHGIKPVVFEQKNRVGESFDHCGATLQIFTRPYDPLDYLREKFNIELKPTQICNKIIMHAHTKTATVKGNQGYFFLRGSQPGSLENQLYNSIKSRVYFNTRADYAQLAREYDYVVVANGSFDISRTMGLWSSLFKTYLIGANITGDFDITTLIMWLDIRYAKSAYAYLTPMGKDRAFLGLVVPRATPDEAREHWRLFWAIEKHPWNIVYEAIAQHVAGFVYPHQVDNILVVGTAGGFLEPFLGFGVVASLQSGMLAARAIATGEKYEDMLVQLKEDMKHSLVFRDLFANLDNADIDRLVTVLGTPGIKQFIYNTNIDLVRMTTAVVGKIQKYWR